MRRPQATPVCLAAGVGLLMLVWLMTVPLGAGHDEGSHYVRAVATGHGKLTGGTPKLLKAYFVAKYGRAATTTPFPDLRSDTERAERYALDTTRQFDLPRSLAVLSPCPTVSEYLDSRQAFVCPPLRAPAGSSKDAATPTLVGVYPPWPYVLPGLSLRGTSDVHTAYRLVRVVPALCCLLLFCLAIAAAWRPDRGAISLAAPALMISPLAIYLGSVLNTSGTEIAGSICLSVSLMRVLRYGPAPPVAWAGCAAGAAGLALSRPTGPAYLVFVVLACVLVAGPARVPALVRGRPRLLVPTAAVGVIVFALSLSWLGRGPSQPADAHGLWSGLGKAISGAPGILVECAGFFPADYQLPPEGWVVWCVIVALVLGGATAAAGTRDRTRLVVLLVVTFAAVVFATDLHHLSGGRMYCRYIAPLLTPLFAYAGVLLADARDGRWAPQIHALALIVLGGAGYLQAIAWFSTARRIAVGSEGPLWFVPDAVWDPPGGWVLWAVLAAAGAIAIGASAINAAALHRRRAAT